MSNMYMYHNDRCVCKNLNHSENGMGQTFIFITVPLRLTRALALYALLHTHTFAFALLFAFLAFHFLLLGLVSRIEDRDRDRMDIVAQTGRQLVFTSHTSPPLTLSSSLTASHPLPSSSLLLLYQGMAARQWNRHSGDHSLCPTTPPSILPPFFSFLHYTKTV